MDISMTAVSVCQTKSFRHLGDFGKNYFDVLLKVVVDEQNVLWGAIARTPHEVLDEGELVYGWHAESFFDGEFSCETIKEPVEGKMEFTSPGLLEKVLKTDEGRKFLEWKMETLANASDGMVLDMEMPADLVPAMERLLAKGQSCPWLSFFPPQMKSSVETVGLLSKAESVVKNKEIRRAGM